MPTFFRLCKQSATTKGKKLAEVKSDCAMIQMDITAISTQPTKERELFAPNQTPSQPENTI